MYLDDLTLSPNLRSEIMVRPIRILVQSHYILTNREMTLYVISKHLPGSIRIIGSLSDTGTHFARGR
jgi:hypothetical protein